MVACLGLLSTWGQISQAQTTSSCPGVTNGSFRGFAALYSECAADVGAGEPYVVAMISAGGGVSLSVDGAPAEDFTPQPTSITEIGIWDTATRYVQEMAEGYTGDCSDITSVDTNISATDGRVYCGVLRTTNDDELLLRGRWNESANVFDQPQILWVNRDGVQPALPVPTLSPWLIFSLGCLMALLGATRRKLTF